jgi:cyclin H
MTYAPEIILHTALFFATKTESHYFALSKFVEEVADTKPENILASEFLLTQGLRFTFDVRHPFRALDGAVMEKSVPLLRALFLTMKPRVHNHTA